MRLKILPMAEQDIPNTLTEMKTALHNMGFLTTWRDPLFARNRTGSASLAIPEKPARFFIFDPSVPEFEPYDFSAIEIALSQGCASFSFTFHYSSIDQTYTEWEDIAERHDTEWVWILREYFLDVERRFGLKWSIDTDKREDTLYGRFPLEEAGKILRVLEAVKELQGNEETTHTDKQIP